MVTLGIEAFLDAGRGGGEPTVGLVTNPSGVTADLESTIDLLNASDSVDIEALFGPTHGIRGNEHSQDEITEHVDEKTGLPVYDLTSQGNGRNGGPNGTTVEQIAQLDRLIYDIQEVGTRFSTFARALGRVLSQAARAETPVTVLDRPNPIAPLGSGGTLASQPGGTALPIVHGMTVGELGRYFTSEMSVDADLTIVEMDDWSRDRWFDDLELTWVPPSPNMPSLVTALVYPGTCLFEATTLSEGRGTTNPFELVGAPWIDATAFAAMLNDVDPPGVKFRPAYFTPMFSKHERSDVEGVQVHVLDREAFDPVRVGVTMVLTAFYEYSECAWVRANGGYPIDDLTGGTELRTATRDVRNGANLRVAIDRIVDEWEREADRFHEETAEYLLYE
ncbi:exo-beta-N-acetylmuramidase NamZ domain-containing protein [Natrarchaeobius sp. A-rgal3]|uniref:exo-beta-N-acetylmuramidase NamZ family protein n=1 Tax=Natrarchaeobius versutus TaxID=1679078 RepID=UPI003510935D